MFGHDPEVELLEREGFLGSLIDYAAAARDGAGRVVLVAGEAGAGKSSLLSALRGRLAEARWLWGACDGSHTPRPLGPIFDIAGQVGSSLGEACRTDTGRDVLFRLLLEDLADSSELTVVVIEDIHWADESTLDLLRFLARRLTQAHVLLLVTYRDDGLARAHPVRMLIGELSALSSVRRIEVPPLSKDAVDRLARRHGMDALELYQLTGGNPFFVTEVLLAPAATVPASAREAVLARVARLPADAQEVLDAAAVIGARVEADLVRQVASCTMGAIDECLTAGALVSVGDGFRFRHEIARRAVATEIPAHRLVELHRRILATLAVRGCRDDARLAHHAEGAGDRAGVQLYAPRAARAAAELAAHREAAAQYERALRFADGLDVRARAQLYDALATENALIDRWEQAESARRRAVALWQEAGEPLRVGDSLRLLGRNLWRLCRLQEAEEALRSSLDLLEQLPPSEELAWAYSYVAHLHMNNRPADALLMAARACRTAESVGAQAALSDALNTEGCALANLGRGGVEQLRRALDVALSIGSEDSAGRAYTNLHSVLRDEYRWDEAERYFDEGLSYAEEHDTPTFATCLRSGHAWMLDYRGRWDEAEAQCLQILNRPDLSPVNRLYTSIPLARIRIRRGDPQGPPMLAQLDRLATGGGEGGYTGELAALTLELAWLRNDAAAVAPAAAQGLAVIDTCLPATRAAFASWLQRCGAPSADPRHVADWRVQADMWAQRRCPYDEALALLDSPHEADLRQALQTFQQLGALATVQRTQQLMRERGIIVIPRGPRSSTQANAFGLTRREQEVLDLLTASFTNSEIAGKLFLSEKTVDHHVSAILHKMGVSTRRDAARRAAAGAGHEPART